MYNAVIEMKSDNYTIYNEDSNFLKKNESLYELEKIFYSEFIPGSPRKEGKNLIFGRRFLFKLRTFIFNPY